MQKDGRDVGLGKRLTHIFHDEHEAHLGDHHPRRRYGVTTPHTADAILVKHGLEDRNGGRRLPRGLLPGHGNDERVLDERSDGRGAGKQT